MRRTTVLCFALSLLLATAVPLWVLNQQAPALEVRAVPRQLPAGKIFPGHAFGQSFRYPAYELSRIEVLLVKQPGEATGDLQLTLREGGPEGVLLHTVENSPLGDEPGPQFVAFEFPKILYANGGQFHFSISLDHCQSTTRQVIGCRISCRRAQRASRDLQA